ncbi:hypothetical protein HYX13_02290 [Candidatus Woesearchaeota archaeon]|nr:hypothetical protein [Candidatus Woesearchaeota archaeon]
MNKKAQGLSINVIIITALALIVLVVLVVIFTGRTAIFTGGVDKEGNAELAKYRITEYGQCRPTARQEENFRTEFRDAPSEVEKEQVKVDFLSEISRCDDSGSDLDTCQANDCKWG